MLEVTADMEAMFRKIGETFFDAADAIQILRKIEEQCSWREEGMTKSALAEEIARLQTELRYERGSA